MGGRVGLKRTDGIETFKYGHTTGAMKEAPNKAIKALRKLGTNKGRIIDLNFFFSDMGENQCKAFRF